MLKIFIPKEDEIGLQIYVISSFTTPASSLTAQMHQSLNFPTEKF